jgi:hypothetical protein
MQYINLKISFLMWDLRLSRRWRYDSLFCDSLLCVVWWLDINVSENCAATIFRVEPWRWWQHGWPSTTRLHWPTAQKTTNYNEIHVKFPVTKMCMCPRGWVLRPQKYNCKAEICQKLEKLFSFLEIFSLFYCNMCDHLSAVNFLRNQFP